MEDNKNVDPFIDKKTIQLIYASKGSGKKILTLVMHSIATKEKQKRKIRK